MIYGLVGGLRAAQELSRTPLRRAADVLVTKTTAPDLADTIRMFAGLGIQRFTLWLLSAADVDDPAVDAEVPRIADVVPFLTAAAAVADELGVELVSLHTPPCTLPPALRPRWQSVRELRLEVVDPSGKAFALETSPFEGSAFAACDACSEHVRCPGPRADYLRLHGDSEVVPLRLAR